MQIDLLGMMRVRRFDIDIEIPAAKQRTLLARLALDADRHVPLDALVDELWGDHPPPTAVRTVQTYAYQIRRRLKLASDPADRNRAALLTSRRGYVLRLGPHSCSDALTFRRGVSEARARLARDDVGGAVGALRAALDLWTGTPFGDVPVGPSLAAARTSLLRARTSARELLFENELRRGNGREIVDELMDLTIAEPLHERFAALLMAALHRGGRRAEAVEAFHRLRRDLDDQLGVEPSGALQGILQAILNDRVGTARLEPVPFHAGLRSA